MSNHEKAGHTYKEVFDSPKKLYSGVFEVAEYKSASAISDKMADPKWRTYIFKICQNSSKVEIWWFQWLVITDPKAKRVKTKWRIHKGVTKLVTSSDNRV